MYGYLRPKLDYWNEPYGLTLTYSVPVLVDGEQAMGYIRYLQVWSLTIHPSFPDPRRTTNPDST